MTDMKKGKLNFPGDVRQATVIGRGPDTLGRMWFPFASEYDEETDKTTIHYYSTTPGVNHD